ncbi:MAG: hypothetical protein GY857_17870 [Desulfobacula sp.]|nr:hypothetical protein [Desulfobacula sp.]
MNKRRIISWLLVVLFIAAIYYLNPDIFKEIFKVKDIAFKNFMMISLLCVSNQFLLGLEIKILGQAFDIHLGVIESFGLSSIRSIANYLPMGAGVISNAIYLKRQKQLSIAKYTSSLTVSIVLMFLVAGSIGLVTSVYIKISSNLVGLDLVLLFFSVFFGSVMLMVAKLPIPESKNVVIQFIKDFQKGYALLRKDRRTIQKLIVLKLLVLLLLTIKMKLLFVFVGYDLTWGSIILIVTGVVAFRIATILPGNIGLTESISGFMAAASGSAFEYGFVGVAVDRIIQTIWIFLLGVFFLFYFSGKLKNSDSQIKKT